MGSDYLVLDTPNLWWLQFMWYRICPRGLRVSRWWISNIYLLCCLEKVRFCYKHLLFNQSISTVFKSIKVLAMNIYILPTKFLGYIKMFKRSYGIFFKRNFFWLKKVLRRLKKWTSDGETWAEYSECGKVSYSKFVIICRVILLTYDRTYLWRSIGPRWLISNDRILLN